MLFRSNQRVLGRAYLRGEAVVVVALHYTRLPIAAIIGFLMFGDVPEIWIWIGGSVIFASTAYITRREAMARQPAIPEAKAGVGTPL